MAERVMAAADRHPGATVLVFSGNVHSRVVAGVPWDPGLATMGARLRARHPQLRAIGFASSGGSTWACITVAGEGGPSCGEHPQGGTDRGELPFVELWDAPGANHHDGIYTISAASPPRLPTEAAAIRKGVNCHTPHGR